MMEKAAAYVLGGDEHDPTVVVAATTPETYLQLDEVVYIPFRLPEGEGSSRREEVIYGVVEHVYPVADGVRYGADAQRAAQGLLLAEDIRAARIRITRYEKDIQTSPPVGAPVYRAEGEWREKALSYDRMERRFPVGIDRTGHVAWANLDFLDGHYGAHVNIAGISGVATKTSYAVFLLYSLLHHANTSRLLQDARAVIFNVKGEDLLFLDRPNADLQDDDRRMYERLGLAAEPFTDVAFWAPPAPGPLNYDLVPATGTRLQGVTSLAWSIAAFCQEGMLRYLFADADRESGQLEMAVIAAERYLAGHAVRQPEGEVVLEGERINDFDDLVEHFSQHAHQIFGPYHIAAGTQESFLRRLHRAARAVGDMVRGKLPPELEREHRFRLERARVHVIDIHGLRDQGKRFVAGIVLRQLLEEKEERGMREPLVFVVLDELNKYAPREGWSPIKDMVVDIAERGRSLGVILIGAQQTAGEVEQRVVGQAALRAAGRLDGADASHAAFRWLGEARRRSLTLGPGSLFFHQPDLPVPLLLRFPHPAWATRPEQAREERPLRELLRRPADEEE